MGLRLVLMKPFSIKILSEKSGIQILTNTGLYTAVGGKYLPPYAFTASAPAAAERDALSAFDFAINKGSA